MKKFFNEESKFYNPLLCQPIFTPQVKVIPQKPPTQLKSQRLLFGMDDEVPPMSNQIYPVAPVQPQQVAPKNCDENKIRIGVYSEKKNQFAMTPTTKLLQEIDGYKCQTQVQLMVKLANVLRQFFLSGKAVSGEWRVFSEIADLAKRNHYVFLTIYLSQVAVRVQPFCLDVWHSWARAQEDTGDSAYAAQVLIESLKFVKYSDSTLSFFNRLEDKISYLRVNSFYKQLLQQLSFDSKTDQNWKHKILLNWAFYMKGMNEKTQDCLQIFDYLLQETEPKTDSFNQAIKGLTNVQLEVRGDVLSCLLDLKKYSRYLNQQTMLTYILQIISYQLLEKNITQQEVNLIINYLNKEGFSNSILIAQFIQVHRTQMDLIQIQILNQITLDNLKQSQIADIWRSTIFLAKVYLFTQPTKVEGLILQMIKYFQVGRSSLMLINFYIRTIIILQKPQNQIQQLLRKIKDIVEIDSNEWKFHLQFILLLQSCGLINESLEIANKAVQQHSTSGRIWASLIQLQNILEKKQFDLKKPQQHSKAFKLFILALKFVPKSGEVWCEGARLYMDPSQLIYDLNQAQICINNAISLTPQYGDSFIEGAKLFRLTKQLNYLKCFKIRFLSSEPTYGSSWHFIRENDIIPIRSVWRKIKNIYLEQAPILEQMIEKREGGIPIPKDVQVGNVKIDSSVFLLTCIPLYNQFLIGNGNNFELKDQINYYMNNDLILAI